MLSCSVDPIIAALISALGGGTFVAWATKRLLDVEIKDRIEAGIKSSIESGALNHATRELIDSAVEKERTVLVARFATREDFARLEGKIDAALARPPRGTSAD